MPLATGRRVRCAGGTWTLSERVSEAYKEAMGALADGVAAVLPGAQLSASTGM